MPRSKTPTPVPVSRAMDSIGRHLATWRRLRQLTIEQLADRAGVARTTVMALESGQGTLENTLRVARALGVLDLLVRATDPYETDLGRARADDELPQRVRPPRGPERANG